jgi:hypothetical protein
MVLVAAVKPATLPRVLPYVKSSMLMEWGLLFGFIVMAVGVSIIVGAGVHASFPSISEDFGGRVAFFVIVAVVGYLLATRLR